MKRLQPLLSLFFAAILFSPWQPAMEKATSDSLAIATPTHEISVSLDDLKRKLKVVTVTLDDPLYKTKKTFDGFNLWEVLALAGPVPEKADEIVFTAKDGYAPTVALSQAKGKGAVLTFQEHQKNRTFSQVRQGKTMLSPAPYYVVWTDPVSEEFPWPYQLVKIEIVSFEKKFPKLYPKDATASLAVKNGFKQFKGQCLRCHSINLEGGDMGPELNTPKNITEYWPLQTLRAFIKRSDSFHAHSKMPAFDGILKEKDIDDILEYLVFMKGHKKS